MSHSKGSNFTPSKPGHQNHTITSVLDSLIQNAEAMAADFMTTEEIALRFFSQSSERETGCLLYDIDEGMKRLGFCDLERPDGQTEWGWFDLAVPGTVSPIVEDF